MPKELTHILIAQEIFRLISGSRQKLLAHAIENNLSAFYLGAIVPDAFYYDVVPKRKIPKDYVKVSNALHLKNMAENEQRAVTLFDAIRINPVRWPLKVAFATGIVTHTVSDRMVHSIIDHYTKGWDQRGSLAIATHRQFETLIDMVMLQQLNLHQRDIQLENFVNVNARARDRLFRFYLEHIIGDKALLHPDLLNAFNRAYAQQRLFLKLFRIKGLYHIINLLNSLSAGRLAPWSSLFYPEAVNTKAFPVLLRLDLNSLTDGRAFSGDLATLAKEVTMRAMHCIQAGLHKLEQGKDEAH